MSTGGSHNDRALEALFGYLVGALPGGRQLFPRDDADDFTAGAGYVPGQVTDARRTGHKLTFVHDGPSSTWHWLMPDGSRVSYDD